MRTAERHGRGVRVLVIDDHALFAEALELALGIQGYDARRLIPDETMSPDVVVARALREKPRIALLDLNLGPCGDGLPLIPPLVGAGVQVVVVTACADHARWGECVRLGVRKVHSKSVPLNEILGTVRRVSQGLPVMTREEAEELLAAWKSSSGELRRVRRRFSRLTPREQVILGQLVDGHVVRDIARAGVVSEATVRTQVKSILAKLEVCSQLAAVSLAHHVDWEPPVASGEEEWRRHGQALA